MYHGVHKKKKKSSQEFSTFVIVKNISYYQHINMISEGSCETEDSSNGKYYFTILLFLIYF